MKYYERKKLYIQDNAFFHIFRKYILEKPSSVFSLVLFIHICRAGATNPSFLQLITSENLKIFTVYKNFLFYYFKSSFFKFIIILVYIFLN
jgi:hypothetical protein